MTGDVAIKHAKLIKDIYPNKEIIYDYSNSYKYPDEYV